MKLKPKKCHLLWESVHFLGHVISKDDIRPDPAKTRRLRNSPFQLVVTDISLLVQWCLPAIADCISLAIRCSSYHALVVVVTPNSHLKSVDHDHYIYLCFVSLYSVVFWMHFNTFSKTWSRCYKRIAISEY